MRRLIALAGVTLLAACSQPSEPEGETADDFAQRAGVGSATAAVPQVAEINAQPVVAPTGAAQLTPLAPDAPRALGKFKGGCSFAYQGRSLLVVRPAVTPGGPVEGVLVVDGQQIILPGSGPVESGPTLSGRGYTVAVARDGSGSRLSVSGPQGETTFAPGTWNCTS